MLVSYNWLKDYIKGKIPSAKELADIITMHSFEVEGFKKETNDWVIDVDVLPNRAHDCLSYLGIARECSAVANLTYAPPIFEIKEDKKIKINDFVSVQIKEKKLCPRYTARMIVEVRVGPSPKKIQRRLRVMGLEPINNVVDILNYVMLETGQPLHAFDFDKLAGKDKKQIIVRKARKKEKIDALDDKTYQLDENILIIADSKEPLAIAGMKGGKKAQISKSTKTIVIESANFEMKSIRYARQKLNLQTDASLRFEHEPDPNLTTFAIDRACWLIQKYCKGKVARGIIDVYPKKVFPKKIKLDLRQVEKILGVKVNLARIKKIFNKLELKILSSDENTLLVEIPTFRQDLSIPQDLVEEIGRIYGFEKIPALIPEALVSAPERNDNVFWGNLTKDILKEIGFCEAYNYSFVSNQDTIIFSLKEKELVKIENPISSEYKYLRPSLIPNLLKNVRENSKHFSEIKIFELGKVYKKLPVSEKRALTGLIANNNSGSQNFYLAKGIVDLLLNKLGISDVWYDEFRPTPEESKMSFWQSKKCAEIKVGNVEVGFLGEISKEIIEKIEIPFSVVVFDFDFEKLQELCCEEHEYQPVSRFPAAVRDLAVLVPREVKVVEVLNLINTAGGPLVRDVDLFDIYEGEAIPEGKKNLAFHIIYQAPDRTLRKEEIDVLQEKIIETLEQNPEWEVRK